MVYRYDFNIQRPDPGIALGAAGLGERMRRNRLLEQQQQLVNRRAERDWQENMRRYGLDQARAAVQDIAGLYQATGDIEDPIARQATFKAGYDRLRRLYPPRDGVDPFEDFDENWRQEEYDSLRPHFTAAKTGPLAQKVADFTATAGRPPTEEELTRMAGAAERAPLVSIGAAGELTDRPLTPEEALTFGLDPEQADRYLVRGGEFKAKPAPAETAEEQEARRTRERRTKDADALVPVLSTLQRYKQLLDMHGAEVQSTIGAGADLAAAYADAQLALKEAANLGVLSGPDLEMIERVLVSPIGLGAKAAESMAERAGATPVYEATLDRQIGALEGRIRELRGEQQTEQGPAIDFSAMSLDEFLAIDPRTLSESQLKAYNRQAERF